MSVVNLEVKQAPNARLASRTVPLVLAASASYSTQGIAAPRLPAGGVNELSGSDVCVGGVTVAVATGGCVAAVIEAARGLIYTDTTFGPDLQRPIYLLFTDGEELGLLGAQQFVKRHPLSAKKPIVLNFDARGTSGPVVMYESRK